MSRLSSNRANAPDLNKKKKPLGPRPKSRAWRKGEAPIVVQPCRTALNEAVSDQNFGKADRICQKKRRKVYSKLSKPALLHYLRTV